jgi:DNA-directed RNA polymerase subunit M/transcription elongation factor TFIIS
MRFDVARFRQDDAHELVIASLACPLCLYSEAVEWELRSDGYDPSVECACPRCEERWRVFMTPDQALRLGLIELGAA